MLNYFETDVCVSKGKSVSFFGKFFVRTKWKIVKPSKHEVYQRDGSERLSHVYDQLKM